MACFPLTINLCHSPPLPHTPKTTHAHPGTHICMRKQMQAHAHTHSSRTQWDRSLIMPLILSDSSMYNSWLPGAMCRGIHPFIHPSLLLFIIFTYLVIHHSIHQYFHSAPHLSSAFFHLIFFTSPCLFSFLLSFRPHFCHFCGLWRSCLENRPL